MTGARGGRMLRWGEEGNVMLSQYKVVAMIPTTDLDRARKFYVDVLGLTPSEEEAGEGMRFSFAEGTELDVFRTRETSGSGHTEAGWEVDDIEAVVATLRDAGVEFEEYDMGEGMRTENGIMTLGEFGRGAWFTDPDGNVLSIFERTT